MHQIQEPNEGDWTKLFELVKCSNSTKERAKDLKCAKWCVDAAFAMHPDHKSHPGAVMIMLLSSCTANPMGLRRVVTGVESPPTSGITLVSSGGSN